MKKMYKKCQVCAIYIVMAISLSGCSSCKEIPELKIFDATDITPVTARIEGSVVSDGTGSVNQYGICFSTHANPDITDFHTTSIGSAGSFTRKLTDLLPNTTYYAKAFATNDAGTGYSENEITFTTITDLFASNMETFPGEFWVRRLVSQSWLTGLGQFSLSLTDETYSSPNHSIKISRAVATQDTVFVLGKTTTEPIPVGRNLTLEVLVKGVNLDGRGVSLVIRCDNSTEMKQFVTTENNMPINGTFNWIKYSVKLNKVQNDITYIMIYLIYLNNTTGSVYFDDVKLKVE